MIGENEIDIGGNRHIDWYGSTVELRRESANLHTVHRHYDGGWNATVWIRGVDRDRYSVSRLAHGPGEPVDLWSAALLRALSLSDDAMK